MSEDVTVEVPDHLLRNIDTLDPTLGVTREERVQFLIKRALLDLPTDAFVPAEFLNREDYADSYEMWEAISSNDAEEDRLPRENINMVEDEEGVPEGGVLVTDNGPMEKALSWLYGDGEGDPDGSISTDAMDDVTCTIVPAVDGEAPGISFRAKDSDPFTEQDVLKLTRRVRPALDEHDTRIKETRGGEEHTHYILVLTRKASPSNEVPPGWSLS